MKEHWELVTEYDVAEYKCGLRAGDSVRLIRDIHVLDHKDRPTGEIYRAGEFWTVLHGSRHTPGVLWLLRPDGERHTWDDDPSIFEHFCRVGDEHS